MKDHEPTWEGLAADRDFMDMIHWGIRVKTTAPTPFDSISGGGFLDARNIEHEHAIEQHRKCMQRLMFKMLWAKWGDKKTFSNTRSPIFK